MTAVQHQAARARKLRAAARVIGTHFPEHLPAFLCLTDPKRMPDPVAIMTHLPKGSGVIYRHFGSADRIEIAARLAEAAEQHGLILMIAADPDLACEVKAAGVHWPEARLAEARAWRGVFAIQTASAHSRNAIWRAARSCMDAALVSTVFPSRSPSAGRPIGPARLARLAIGTHLPLYGLGGVTAHNVNRVAEFAGMAAIQGLKLDQALGQKD